jgi:hypothetical protein
MLGAVVFSGALLAQAPSAQQPATREESIALRQAEKARTAQPPKPDKAERWVLKAEDMFLVNPSGFFPYFGSVYHGGGLTVGAGYRKFYGDNSFWEVKGLYSVLNYKLIEGGTVSRDHWNRMLSFGSRLGWRDATEVPYYGLGQNNTKDDRANFRFQQTYLEGFAELRPRRWLPIRGTVGYEHWNLLSGKGDEPSIETVYTPQTAPGLGASPSYVHSQVSVGIDWRQSPGYSTRGGLYQATLHDYNNTGSGAYSFQRLDTEVIQYLPLYRETWVLAARGKMQTTLNNNDLIPYFLLPALGSGDTLRAYNTDRFRDRHSLLFNLEFRWLPARALDMAVFYDAGKVASRRSDLDFTKMKSDVGIGARIHGLMATPLRVDLAVGNEGWRIVFSGGPVF